MNIALSSFSGIILTVSLMVIFYLIFGITEKSTKKYLLILLIFSMFLRLGKSFVYYLLTDASHYGIVVGFLGYAYIGPLLYFYFNNHESNLSKIFRLGWVHSVFPIFGAVLFTLKPLPSGTPLMLLCFVSYLSYLTLIIYKWKVQDIHINNWDRTLVMVVSAINLIFFLQWLLPYKMFYVLGTALGSLIFAVWFIYMLREPLRLKKEVKSTKPKPSISQVKKIKTVLIDNKAYRNSGLTLKSFSNEVDIPEYIISTVTKQEFEMSFPKLVNSLRIEEIKDILRDNKYADQKIEILAYDVGYSSPSSFYDAFKKATDMSPRSYQKQYAK